MHPMFKKIFCTLSPQYYWRHFVFGLIFPIIYLAVVMPSVSLMAVLFLSISTFLYPYSRFVYESIMRFIMGNNVFFVNALLMLLVKVFTIFMCFYLAIFIAPIGLFYLYLRQQKNQDISNAQ
jgi:hypothetical protein